VPNHPEIHLLAKNQAFSRVSAQKRGRSRPPAAHQIGDVSHHRSHQNGDSGA